MASQFPILYSTRSQRSVDPFLDLSRQMNWMMDNFFPGASSLMGIGASAITEAAPRIDVQEDMQQICITAELPGIEADDFEVRVDGDLITICGEKKTQSETNLDSYRVMERSFGSFRRTVPLPFTPDSHQISADYRQGVLTIHVPKQAQLDLSQRIPVRDSSEDVPHRGQTVNAAQQQTIEGQSESDSQEWHRQQELGPTTEVRSH